MVELGGIMGSRTPVQTKTDPEKAPGEEQGEHVLSKALSPSELCCATPLRKYTYPVCAVEGRLASFLASLSVQSSQTRGHHTCQGPERSPVRRARGLGGGGGLLDRAFFDAW